jgi:putative membrane protein
LLAGGAATDEPGTLAFTIKEIVRMDDRVTSNSAPAAISRELSARNTGLALQRTRMAADRTLMGVIRTSLSLISFGFTIAQIVERLVASNMLRENVSAGRHFGIALVLLGIMMLTLGIAYHGQFMIELRRERKLMTEDGLIHGKSKFPVSLTLITAVVLLGIGIAAGTSMLFHVGPFE